MVNVTEIGNAIAANLKMLRTERKENISVNLSNMIEEETGIRISKSCLMNYEKDVDEYSSKSGTNLGMNVKYLCALADFYGVSTDFLLGRSPVRSQKPDDIALAMQTGLSWEAIDFLRNDGNRKDLTHINELFMKNNAPKTTILEILNRFFDTHYYSYYQSILAAIDQAIECYLSIDGDGNPDSDESVINSLNALASFMSEDTKTVEALKTKKGYYVVTAQMAASTYIDHATNIIRKAISRFITEKSRKGAESYAISTEENE